MSVDSLLVLLVQQTIQSEQSSDSEVYASIDKLLSHCCHLLGQATNHNKLLKEVSHVLKDAAPSYPNVCDVLLVHLQDLANPFPFFEDLPIIFLGATDENICNLVTILQEMLSLDNRLLLPILSTLADLKLNTYSAAALLQIAEGAISTADEADFPFLFRTLLKGLSVNQISSMILKLRQEVCNHAIILPSNLCVRS